MFLSDSIKIILGNKVLGAISKKVISYPTGGCMKGAQELTFYKEIKNTL